MIQIHALPIIPSLLAPVKVSFSGLTPRSGHVGNGVSYLTKGLPWRRMSVCAVPADFAGFFLPSPGMSIRRGLRTSFAVGDGRVPGHDLCSSFSQGGHAKVS
jgi:hypothetical protein